MNIHNLLYAFCALSIISPGCGERIVSDSSGVELGSETAGDDDGDPATTTGGDLPMPDEESCTPTGTGGCAGEEYPIGEMWGPCPTISGLQTLCNDSTLACVPAVDITHNVCLPVNYCPTPPYGSHGEPGWGGACYPRCTADSECVGEQRCVSALADGGNMCAWPTG